jgi:hypothetical protein
VIKCTGTVDRRRPGLGRRAGLGIHLPRRHDRGQKLYGRRREQHRNGGPQRDGPGPLLDHRGHALLGPREAGADIDLSSFQGEKGKKVTVIEVFGVSLWGL